MLLFRVASAKFYADVYIKAEVVYTTYFKAISVPTTTDFITPKNTKCKDVNVAILPH